MTVKLAAPCPPVCPNKALPLIASITTARIIRLHIILHPHRARLACRKAVADCNPWRGERHSGLFLLGVGLQFRFCLRFFVSAGIRDQIEDGIFVFFNVFAGAGVLDLGGDVDGLGFGGVDDSGGLVGVNLREGAEEQAADVGKNGGATRGNTVLGQKRVQVVEGMVDALRGLEVLAIAAEIGVVIGGFLFALFNEVLGTENRARIGDVETAPAAAGRAMGATNGKSNALSSLRFHVCPLLRAGEWPEVVIFDAECGND
jgi:hypothetical protein